MISRRSFLLGATALAAVPAAKSMRYMTLEELRAREMLVVIESRIHEADLTGDIAESSLEFCEIELPTVFPSMATMTMRALIDAQALSMFPSLGRDGIALKSIAHPWP